jgi:RNA polymerase sigma factor (sigma-70 family)
MEPDARPGCAVNANRVAQHRTELVAIAHRILRDHDAAEDIVQETIAATLKRLPMIAPEKVDHYLSRAVRQNAIKSVSRRRKQCSLEEIPELAKDGRPDAIAGIDPFELEDAIKSLPASQQTVVRMKYYLDMTFRQIGISLSISTHTAASRCRYAIVRLKHLLID